MNRSKKPQRRDFGLPQNGEPPAEITQAELDVALTSLLNERVYAIREDNYQRAMSDWNWANGGR
jgi:hypothetical protein